MGVFQDTVEIFNRTTGTKHERKLTVQFDGQQHTIPVGKSHLPRIVVSYAKNQNPVMGTEEESNPNSYDSYIGVVGKDDCSPVEPNGEITRVAQADFLDPSDKVLLRGKKVRSTFEASVPQLGGMVDVGKA